MRLACCRPSELRLGKKGDLGAPYSLTEQRFGWGCEMKVGQPSHCVGCTHQEEVHLGKEGQMTSWDYEMCSDILNLVLRRNFV